MQREPRTATTRNPKSSRVVTTSRKREACSSKPAPTRSSTLLESSQTGQAQFFNCYTLKCAESKRNPPEFRARSGSYLVGGDILSCPARRIRDSQSERGQVPALRGHSTQKSFCTELEPFRRAGRANRRITSFWRGAGSKARRE